MGLCEAIISFRQKKKKLGFFFFTNSKADYNEILSSRLLCNLKSNLSRFGCKSYLGT